MNDIDPLSPSEPEPTGEIAPAPASEPAPTPAPAPTPEPAPVADPRPERPGVSLGSAIGIAVVAALIVGSFAGITTGFVGTWIAMRADSGSGSSGGTRSIKVLPSETEEPVVAAAAAALPCVVNIDVMGEDVTAGEGGLPQEHPTVPYAGNGSGVAFRAADDGGTYVLTNNHVVEDAKTIVVTDSSQEKYSGKVIGTDADTDVAVVRIDGELPLIEVGDSDDLQVGQMVVAIGSPYGLSQSVSSGVISAIGRSLPDSFAEVEGVYPLVDVIQTDAAINPGNSGGALVDRDGALVGINTAIYSESGASDGVGFAVPINNAIGIAEQLIKTGTAEHPFLGVVGRDVDPSQAEDTSLGVESGAVVIEVTEGANAGKAGVKAGDVIVGLDEDTIRSMDDLLLQVRRREIGDTVTLHIVRDGKRIELEMTVGVKPKNLEMPTSQETTEAP